MDGSALFLIAFGAVVVMILVTVWAALVMEAGARRPGRQQEDVRPAGGARATGQARAHRERGQGS